MAYNIVFIEKEDATPRGPAAKERAVGEQTFLANLPVNPKVFAFYYPGHIDTEDVEKRLRGLGRRTGDNLYVNMGTLTDPSYKRAAERFGIKRLPVVVVTAVSPLASTPDGETAFVRLDNESLFAEPERLVRTVEELFNLFLAGRIRTALVQSAVDEATRRAGAVVERIWAVIQPAIQWLASRDLTIALFGAQVEVKASEQRQ